MLVRTSELASDRTHVDDPASPKALKRCSESVAWGTIAGMKVVKILATVVLAGVALVASFAVFGMRDLDRTDEAARLERELARMPGVKSAQHDYEMGSRVDPGSAGFSVQMRADSTIAETLAVLEAEYRASGKTFALEHVDFGAHRGRTEISVHVRDPDADLDDLLSVARFALTEPLAGEHVAADMSADEEYTGSRFVSELRLSLGRGSVQRALVPRIRTLAAGGDVPAGTDVWVLAADGSGIGGSRGLPKPRDIAIWRELSSYASAGKVRVEFGPHQMYSDLGHYGFANVSVRATPEPTKPQLAALKRAFVARLAARSSKYVLNVTVNGEDSIWLQGPDCLEGSDC